jgi:hypothetical protein
VQVSLSTPTSTSVDRTLAIGKTYRFTLRATDGAGNTGGYATTATAKLARGEETSSAITSSGSWKRVTLSGASGGYVKKSTASGARATYAFSGSAIGFVSARGSSRGITELWLDGAKVATIDLYAPAAEPARLVWASGVLANTAHTLQVRVTGTKNAAASNFRVDADAFVRWT